MTMRILLLFAVLTCTGYAFLSPSPSSSSSSTSRLYRNEDEMGGWLLQRWPGDDVSMQEEAAETGRRRRRESQRQPQTKIETSSTLDYEGRVDRRFSRHFRREFLRNAISYGAEMDLRRRELDVANRWREATAAGGGTTSLLVNTPIPIKTLRTNSDFPGSELPASRWDQVAAPPMPFEDAEYSPCVRVTARILVPWDGGDATDGVGAEEEGRTPVVVFNGIEYAVKTVDDVLVVPTSGGLERGEHSSQPTATGAYWLRTKLRDAIYGQVCHGTVLQKLNAPIQVMLPPKSTSPSSSKVVDEWAFVEWIATNDDVAVKEMSWDHIQKEGPQLAEDPIKEVAAMQYLKQWVDNEEEKRRRGASLHQKIGFHLDAKRGKELPMTSSHEESNIMMPLDLLSDDENLYSITPFCTGGRLLDHVESKNRFSEPEARYWMRQILNGLSCLKRAGVVHRDMSPENLMVHDGQVYIIDLGMCLRIPSLDDAGDDMMDAKQQQQRFLILPQAPCGKWYYLSPEVLLSEQPFDGPTVDLWAAGVILYIMLTGLPPWEEPKTTDDNFNLMSTGYLVQILTERRVGLSADAMDLLQRMFWKDPADRLSLEQVCDHPWITHQDDPAQSL